MTKHGAAKLTMRGAAKVLMTRGGQTDHVAG